MEIRATVTGLFFIICVAAEAMAFVSDPCEGKHVSTMKQSQSSGTDSAIQLDSKQITMGQPFSFNFKVIGQQPDRVTANAIMPAHQHGMNYTPTISYNETEQRYLIQGFVFHMPGHWEVTVSSYIGDAVTHHVQDVTIN